MITLIYVLPVHGEIYVVSYSSQILCKETPYLGILIYGKPLFLRTVRETITRQAEGNHMEANFIRRTLCQ